MQKKSSFFSTNYHKFFSHEVYSSIHFVHFALNVCCILVSKRRFSLTFKTIIMGMNNLQRFEISSPKQAFSSFKLVCKMNYLYLRPYQTDIFSKITSWKTFKTSDKTIFHCQHYLRYWTMKSEN